MDENQRKKYLSELGIETWLIKKPISTLPKIEASINHEKKWQNLQEEIKKCQLCALHKSRTQAVFGIGSKNAKLLFIGEAPGANEDLQGEPFVGRAGMLLNSMLEAIGLNRNEVYIANILKCRPPNNRDPEPSEVSLCTSFLLRQIDLINPNLIVAVGRIAAQFLLETKEPMTRLRGQQYLYGTKSIPLLVTYHPAYLLRSPREKSKAYQDLLLIKNRLTEI